MAVDPKKLEAYVNKGGAPSKPKGGFPPPPKGGKPAEEPEEPAEEEDLEDDEEGGEEGEGGDLAEYGELMEVLRGNAEQVEEQVEMLDQGLLTDPGTEDPEFLGAVGECLDALDQGVVDAMKECLPGVSWDTAMDIAEALADEGVVVDAEPVAGFLFHAARTL
jgi:hypothetical protein